MIRRLAICFVFAAWIAAAPAWGQSTNQLYMTGTGSGNTPVLYTNGVDTDINLAIMPKGAGGVGIGTTSPNSLLTVGMTNSGNGITIQNNSSSSALFPGLTITDYTGGNGGNSALSFVNGRGTSSSTAAIQSGDTLGGIGGFGVYDTSNHWGKGAQIAFFADGNFSSSSFPTNIAFGTTASGSTTNTERMRITASGNVGIGTTGPAYPLVVQSASTVQAVFASTGTNNSGVIIDNAAGGNQSDLNFDDAGTTKWQLGKLGNNSFFLWDAANSVSTFTISTAGLLTLGEAGQLSLPASGSVGIGTTSPGALLDIGLPGTTTGTLRLEGITSGYVQIQPSAAAGSWTMTLPTAAPASNGFVLSSTTAGVTSWVANGGGSASSLSSITSATASNTIDSTNFVQTWKWGTLSTQTALSFVTSSMTTGTLLNLTNSATGNNAGTVLSVTNNEANAASYGINVSTASTGTGYGVYSSITGTSNTGYAGYFQNAPGTNAGVNYAVYVTNNTTAAGYGVSSSLTSASNTGYAGYFSNSTTKVGFGAYSTVTAHSNTGYAGYFANTDTSTNVNYGIYASAPGANAWAGYFGGNIGLTGTITMTSDRRMKKDIVSIDPATALDEIAALRPVSFAWRKNDQPDMGLIAQEVDDVFPTIVVHSPDDSLALKYISLMAPIIASIQELKKRNDAIEAENDELRNDFEAYKQDHP